MTTYHEAELVDYDDLRDEDTQLNDESVDELWALVPETFRADPTKWDPDKEFFSQTNGLHDFWAKSDNMWEKELKAAAKAKWERRKERRANGKGKKKKRNKSKEAKAPEKAMDELNDRITIYRQQVDNLYGKQVSTEPLRTGIRAKKRSKTPPKHAHATDGKRKPTMAETRKSSRSRQSRRNPSDKQRRRSPDGTPSERRRRHNKKQKGREPRSSGSDSHSRKRRTPTKAQKKQQHRQRRARHDSGSTSSSPSSRSSHGERRKSRSRKHRK